MASVSRVTCILVYRQIISWQQQQQQQPCCYKSSAILPMQPTNIPSRVNPSMQCGHKCPSYRFIYVYRPTHHFHNLSCDFQWVYKSHINPHLAILRLLSGCFTVSTVDYISSTKHSSHLLSFVCSEDVPDGFPSLKVLEVRGRRFSCEAAPLDPGLVQPHVVRAHRASCAEWVGVDAVVVWPQGKMSAEAAERTGGRPSSPVQTSWFEFLLDGGLLETHLHKPSPGQFHPEPSVSAGERDVWRWACYFYSSS